MSYGDLIVIEKRAYVHNTSCFKDPSDECCLECFVEDRAGRLFVCDDIAHRRYTHEHNDDRCAEDCDRNERHEAHGVRATRARRE